MRVREKGSDREAEVHLNSLGSVNELEEFCQYVDPVDKAICCYVPVEKGSVIRVKGTFSGRVSFFFAHDLAFQSNACRPELSLMMSPSMAFFVNTMSITGSQLLFRSERRSAQIPSSTRSTMMRPSIQR